MINSYSLLLLFSVGEEWFNLAPDTHWEYYLNLLDMRFLFRGYK